MSLPVVAGLRARVAPEALDPVIFALKGGLAPLADAGLGRPLGERVLVRTVMLQDVAGVGHDGKPIEIIGSDQKKAMCHRVEALGPDVPAGINVGDFVVQISAAADVLDWVNKGCRYSLVNYRDCIWAVAPGELAAYARRLVTAG